MSVYWHRTTAASCGGARASLLVAAPAAVVAAADHGAESEWWGRSETTAAAAADGEPPREYWDKGRAPRGRQRPTGWRGFFQIRQYQWSCIQEQVKNQSSVQKETNGLHAA